MNRDFREIFCAPRKNRLETDLFFTSGASFGKELHGCPARGFQDVFYNKYPLDMCLRRYGVSLCLLTGFLPVREELIFVCKGPR